MTTTSTGFGRYELLRRIGAGGMAETFVARRLLGAGIEQILCLKRLLPHHADDPMMRALFLAEARLTASILHGGVARVIDVGAVDERCYLALELVDGVDLRQLLHSQGGRLPEWLVLHLAFELGMALDFSHAVDHSTGRTLGIIHRDISPSNVLTSRDGELKLTDFGIAKAMNNATSARTTIIKGKIAYMAPEYARRGVYGVTTDLYALGVMLYECLVGRRPFDGPRDIDTLERAQRGQHPPLRELAPATDPALARVIERLIAPQPEARMASAAHMIDALPRPPSTVEARGRLAALVRAAAAEREAKRVAEDLAAKAKATQAATQQVGQRPPRPLPVIPAGPNDVTRTSVPLALAESTITLDTRALVLEGAREKGEATTAAAPLRGVPKR